MIPGGVIYVYEDLNLPEDDGPSGGSNLGYS